MLQIDNGPILHGQSAVCILFCPLFEQQFYGKYMHREIVHPAPRPA